MSRQLAEEKTGVAKKADLAVNLQKALRFVGRP
jgi:hypothetical protein